MLCFLFIVSFLTRFEVLTAVGCWRFVFYDAALCCWLSSSRLFERSYCLRNFGVTSYAKTQRNIPEDFYLFNSFFRSASFTWLLFLSYLIFYKCLLVCISPVHPSIYLFWYILLFSSFVLSSCFLPSFLTSFPLRSQCQFLAVCEVHVPTVFCP